jgi:hypothetical protein
MKGKSIIEKAIGLIAAVLFTVLICYLALEFFMPAEENPTQQFSVGDKPPSLALSLSIPEEEDDMEDKIEFAVMLYDQANALYKNTEDVALMVASSTSMFGGLVKVPGYRYIVKNSDEYYYLEYSFIPPSNDAISGLFSGLAGAIAKESTQFALRKYYDSSMDSIRVQRVINPTPSMVFDEETGKNIYTVDWTEVVDEEEDIPIFYSGQSVPYVQTEQIINEDTVTSAEVSYNAEEGYYTLVLELDTTLATTLTQARLRENSDNDQAFYTRLIQTIEIWDNGYFRYFRAQDDWEGPGAITMTSEIDFRTYFYYDEFWTNPENYQHMAELKEVLGN